MLRTAISLAEKHSSRIAAACIGLVLITGLLYSSWLGSKLRFPDENVNVTLATHLASAHVYSFDGKQATAFVPPGYPMFLTPLVYVGAEIVMLRAVNFLLLGGCMYLTFRLLKRHSGQLAATVGVLLILGYPVLFYTAGTLYSQTLAACLLLAVMLLYVRLESSLPTVILRGLLMGWLVLTVPITLVVIMNVTIWRWIAFPRESRVHTLGSLLVALLLIGSWSTRNYLTFDAFVPVSTNSGLNLLLGNSEHTTPNAGVNISIAEHLEKANSLGEAEKDKFFRAKAFDFIRSNKLRTAKLYCLKFLNYFNYHTRLYSVGEQTRARDVVMFVTYVPLLVLLIVRMGCYRAFPLAAWEWLFLSTYLLSGLAYAVFFTRIRFRLPFDFLLICLVAHFVGMALAGRNAAKGHSEIETGNGT